MITMTHQARTRSFRFWIVAACSERTVLAAICPAIPATVRIDAIKQWHWEKFSFGQDSMCPFYQSRHQFYAWKALADGRDTAMKRSDLFSPTPPPLGKENQR